MTLSTLLHRRLFVGAAVLSLLAMAGAATTFATTSSHAQSSTPNTAVCAQQDAEPDGSKPEGPDTDTADVQCGDQTGSDAEGADSADEKESAGPDTDNLEEGDQTTPDVAGPGSN